IVGFLPFVLSALHQYTNIHLYMAIVSWPEWAGYTKGMEISLLDVLALALYLSLPPSRHPLPFKLSMMLYFLAVLLSAFVAEFPLAVLFYAWQLARMFLVYAAVTKAVSNDARVARALMTAMAVGL